MQVLRLAREDGGIDIKDDCRLDDASARCHQDRSTLALSPNPNPNPKLAVT